jgi:hypothetical protein
MVTSSPGFKNTFGVAGEADAAGGAGGYDVAGHQGHARGEERDEFGRP